MAKDKLGLEDLTEADVESLKTAYEHSIKGDLKGETILYGYNDPFCITAIHILAKQAGIKWRAYYHSATPVTTTAIGANSELFEGNYDNTDLSNKLALLIADVEVSAK